MQESKSGIQEFLQTVDGFQLYHEKVSQVLEEFRFDRVREVMEQLDWQWASWKDEDGEIQHNRVPSEFAIKQCAIRLLSMAIGNEEVSTGGLRAVVEYYPDEPIKERLYVGLQFILEDVMA